jgi:hypothetical protein
MTQLQQSLADQAKAAAESNRQLNEANVALESNKKLAEDAKAASQAQASDAQYQASGNANSLLAKLGQRRAARQVQY